MKNNWKDKLGLGLLGAGALIIAGCGGSSSDGDGGGSLADLSPLSALLETDGTWLISMSGDMSLSLQIIDGITMNSDITFNERTVTTTRYANGMVTDKSCDALPPEVYSPTDLDIEFSDIAGPGQTCPGESSTLTRISDTHYRLDYTCGKAKASFEIAKLSDSPQFDQGSLTFQSALNDDLNATSGVCGSFEDTVSVSTYTPQPNDYDLVDTTETVRGFSVTAPYGSDLLEMDFSVVADLAVGTYNVTTLASLADEIEVALISPAFGGTSDNPATRYASSGSVTIEAVSNYAIRGTFNLNTVDGDNLAGSFDIDIGPQ